MFLRGILLLLGITLTVIGLTNIILYLNLLVNGYTFLEYVNFIIRRFECLSLIIGILLIYLSIYRRKKWNIFMIYC